MGRSDASRDRLLARHPRTFSSPRIWVIRAQSAALAAALDRFPNLIVISRA